MYEKPMQPVAKAYIIICEYIHLCINTYKSFSLADVFFVKFKPTSMQEDCTCSRNRL